VRNADGPPTSGGGGATTSPRVYKSVRFTPGLAGSPTPPNNTLVTSSNSNNSCADQYSANELPTLSRSHSAIDQPSPSRLQTVGNGPSVPESRAGMVNGGNNFVQSFSSSAGSSSNAGKLFYFNKLGPKLG